MPSNLVVSSLKKQLAKAGQIITSLQNGTGLLTLSPTMTVTQDTIGTILPVIDENGVLLLDRAPAVDSDHIQTDAVTGPKVPSNTIATVHIVDDATLTVSSTNMIPQNITNGTAGAYSEMDFVATAITNIYYDDMTAISLGGAGHDISADSVTFCSFSGMMLPGTSEDFTLKLAIEAYDGTWTEIHPIRQYKFRNGHLLEPYDTNITNGTVNNWSGLEWNFDVVVPKGYTKVRAAISGNCPNHEEKPMRLLNPCPFFYIQSHKQA